MAAVISILVLAGAVLLFPFLLALTYWLDRPQTEAVWQEELRVFPTGLFHLVIARLHRVWLRKEGKNHEGRIRGGEGISPRRNASENQAHSGGRGDVPKPSDGNDSPGVLLGDSNEIRGRNLSSDGRLPQGGGRAETQGSTPTGEGTNVAREDRRPRPSGGVSDSVRSIQPAGGQRPESDGDDDAEESFAEALERRGRELGI